MRMARGSFISSDKSRKVYTPPRYHGTNSNHSNNSTAHTQITDDIATLTKEEKMSRYEAYIPTGDFAKDFSQLCSYLGLRVQVIARPQIPSSAPPSRCDESRATKVKDEKKQTNVSLKEEEKGDIVADDAPVTYTLAENDAKFLQPRVEIDMVKDYPSKDSIKGVYMRTLRVSPTVVEVLSKTMPDLEQLSVLNMWNVGLTDETLVCLGKCIMSSPALKTLSLDGNTNCVSQRFDIFLQEGYKCTIENLSLRNCNLDDGGALHISDALVVNASLLTLNLSFNKLTDTGVDHLARCLRTNRTLLSLNLSGNNISDRGAKYISEALSTFPLTHDQVVAKRFKDTILKGDNFIVNEEKGTCPIIELPRSRERRCSSVSSNGLQSSKGIREKPIMKKRETPPKSRNENPKRENRPISQQKTQKGKQEMVAKVDIIEQPSEAQWKSEYEFPNPILEKSDIRNGEHWIPGNRSLINLNLSRNQISGTGLEYLRDAVRFQVEYAQENEKERGVGVLRISLKNNSFSTRHPCYVDLTELLKSRDPVLIRPTENGVMDE